MEATPTTPPKTPMPFSLQIAETDPCPEDLERGLSDEDLVGKGLEFASRFLIYKGLSEAGLDTVGAVEWQAIMDHLERLFPEEFDPTFRFRESMNWAARRALYDWKVAKIMELRGFTQAAAEIALLNSDVVHTLCGALGFDPTEGADEEDIIRFEGGPFAQPTPSQP
jgi:hypothetical protein